MTTSTPTAASAATPPPIPAATTAPAETLVAVQVVQQPVLYKGRQYLKGQTIKVAPGDVAALGEFVITAEQKAAALKKAAAEAAPATPPVAAPAEVAPVDQAAAIAATKAKLMADTEELQTELAASTNPNIQK